MTPMAMPDDKDELVAEYNTGRYHDTVSAYVRPSFHYGKWCMWVARGSNLLTIDSWYSTWAEAAAHAREFVEARRREAKP